MVSLWFPHLSTLFNINNYIIILLGVVSMTGDYIVAHTKLHLFQAVFDNATHGTVGALSWLYVCINVKNRSHIETLIEIGLCAGIASAIDVDHFIAARSYHLKDATNLQKRPPLHCSTFPFIFCFLLLLLSYIFQVDFWKKVALIIFTAFASHHTRDATRRGFWLYPFGSTPPISYCFYVFITCSIPFIICVLHQTIRIEGSKFSFVSKGSVI